MTRRINRCLIAALFCVAAFSAPAGALEAQNLLLLDNFTNSKPLSNGLELNGSGATEQIVALRDDVIRIRVGAGLQLPEDASWAVSQDVRKTSVTVKPDNSDSSKGFCTRLLCVHVDRRTLRMRVTDLDGNILQEDSDAWPAERHDNIFRLYKKMPEDEHYFGLGDKVGPLDRRNQAFTLWNTDTYKFQESTDPIYKSIPFFMTLRQGRSIGVLMDNTWRSSFDFGKQTENVYSFGASGGAIDYYILYGPNPKQVLEAYGWLTGHTPLPPRWSLGYQQSRYSYETEKQLREVASTLREHRIPADALYLDIDFQEKNRPFTIDPVAFPNFTQMLADLKKQNFHVVAITDLHIASLPNSNYAPYDSGVAGDHFVKNPDGTTYVGRVWPGPSVFPDFSRQKSREWWGSLYAGLLKDGAAGFWNDMNEPSVFDGPGGTMPDNAQHRIDEPGFLSRTAPHLELHNVYGMLNSRATYEGLLKLNPNQRPFVLTRGTYAGGQRYAATWTGDNSSTWNHLHLATPMLLNLGLSGFGLSGADVGGFIGSPQPELLTKWIEIATFQPIDRNHTEKGTAAQEPWVHGEMHEKIRQRFIEERYRLMPYIYTTAEEMSRTGVPMMRPLFLEFPKAASDAFMITAQSSEFLFGRDLLVSLSSNPDALDNYQVRFPSPDWYDYWTGERIEAHEATKNTVLPTQESTNLTVHPTLENLPVYVRGGAIIPMQPVTQSTQELPQGPLTVRVYPGNECQGEVYLDDGETMAYKNGEFLRMRFTCDDKPGSLKLHISAHEGTYVAWWKQMKLEVFGWKSSGAVVRLNGKQIVSASVDSTQHSVTASIPDEGHGAEVEIVPQL